APLALEIAAWNLARGEGLLLVVHGEWKEVAAGFLFLGGNDSGENGGLAVSGEHGAISLTGDAAGVYPERGSRPFDFYGLFIQHVDVSQCVGRDTAASSASWLTRRHVQSSQAEPREETPCRNGCHRRMPNRLMSFWYRSSSVDLT